MKFENVGIGAKKQEVLSRPLVTVDPYVSLIGSLVLEANRISLQIRILPGYLRILPGYSRTIL